MKINMEGLISVKEVKEFLLDELKDEYGKMLSNKENHYSYLMMILNDIGITIE